MAMLIMVVWDTEENQRSKYTKRTLECLLETVDFAKHRLFISDNGSCQETKAIYKWLAFQFIEMPDKLIIQYNGLNIGTAKALNQGLKIRAVDELCIKLDGDVVIKENNWIERLCEVVERDKSYGIAGLKRKDLAQSPNTADLTFKSRAVMLPHEPGQTWIMVEECNDIIGTCTLFNPLLLDAIGFSWQISTYGFEDVLFSLRSRLAGFKNCFLNWIEIDHIDDGSTPYAQQKIEVANNSWAEYQKVHTEYCKGTRSIYEDGGFND